MLKLSPRSVSPKSARVFLALALALVFAALYLSDLPLVPFHPDESTQIAMSRDFDVLVLQCNPAALAWNPDQPPSPQDTLHLLDAPLTRYLIGLSWWLHGYSASDLNTDWEWPQTWDANRQAGHMPAPNILLAARLPGALLSALSVMLVFLIGEAAGGMGVGLVAALLFGFNPLILLHGRRAMAEGPAMFFSLLAVWGSMRLARVVTDGVGVSLLKLLGQSVLAGILIGLAVASKQTAVALLPAAWLAVAVPLVQWAASRLRRLLTLAGLWIMLGIGCALTFWALNPIMYQQPVPVFQAMLAARADLAQAQTETQRALYPESVTPDVVSRLRAALLEVYLRPPAIWDLPVYVDQLAPQAEMYFSAPLNHLARQPVLGALLAGLGAAGAMVSAWWLRRATCAEQTVWCWAAATLGLILLTIPFDWQRYFMPLVPLACLFAAYGLAALGRPVMRLRLVGAVAEKFSRRGSR